MGSQEREHSIQQRMPGLCPPVRGKSLTYLEIGFVF